MAMLARCVALATAIVLAVCSLAAAQGIPATSGEIRDRVVKQRDVPRLEQRRCAGDTVVSGADDRRAGPKRQPDAVHAGRP